MSVASGSYSLKYRSLGRTNLPKVREADKRERGQQEWDRNETARPPTLSRLTKLRSSEPSARLALDHDQPPMAVNLARTSAMPFLRAESAPLAAPGAPCSPGVWHQVPAGSWRRGPAARSAHVQGLGVR